MKIGVFTDSYRPYLSGVVRSIESFAGELERLGHEVYIFAPRYGREETEETRVFRVPSVRTRFHRDFAVALPLVPHLGAKARELGLEIIHAHSPFIMGRLGARLAQRLDLPLVFTYHTLYDQYVHYVPLARPLARWGAIALARGFCNRADLVITPTRAVERLLQGYGVRTPIEIIPTGIDYGRFQQGDPEWLRREYGIGAEERVLLFVGRLGKEKNLPFLLRAYAAIRQQMQAEAGGGAALRLVIVAGGPEAGPLEELARTLGISEGVVFTGALSPEKVVHCYAGADLFVFASVTETQGLVLAEAQAAGLPVVAVGAYGVLDMVRDGEDGLLTPLREEAFVEAVCRLLRDEELRRRLAAGARRHAQELDLRRQAARLAAAYTAVKERKKEQRAAGARGSLKKNEAF